MDQFYIATADEPADRIAIYGIGTTEAEALDDAAKWVDPEDVDTLVALPCTKRLYDAVEAGQSDCRFRENAEFVQDYVGPRH